MPADWLDRIEDGWGICAGAWSESIPAEPEWFWSVRNGNTPHAFGFVRHIGDNVRDYESLIIRGLDLPATWSRVDIVAMMSRRDTFGAVAGAVADVLEDGDVMLTIDLADDYEREYGVCLARLARRGSEWELVLDGTGFREER